MRYQSSFMRAASRRVRSYGIAEFVTNSPEETQSLGIQLARRLPIPSVVLLRGALGTGKTTLARGIALGLGLQDAALVNSPSFTLVNIYQGRCPVYHVDLYRLEGERDIYSIGLDEFLGRDGVTIVEWCERLLFPAEAAVIVEFEDAGGDSRIIRILESVKRTRKKGAQ
jgi:tRNA threonylcarbamoyladenosine biosynthesis protein TsaE